MCDDPETETENEGGDDGARALAFAATRDTAATADAHPMSPLLFHATEMIEALAAVFNSLSCEQFSESLRFAADSFHASPRPPPAIAVKTPGSARLSRSTELSSMKDVFKASAGNVKDVESPYRG